MSWGTAFLTRLLVRPAKTQADIIEAFNSISRYLYDLLNIDDIYL